MVSLSTIKQGSQWVLPVSLAAFAAAVMMIVFFVIHFNGASEINVEHLTDAEKEALLSTDRAVATLVADSNSGPIEIDGDLILSDGAVFRNPNTLLGTNVIFHDLVITEMFVLTTNGTMIEYRDVIQIIIETFGSGGQVPTTVEDLATLLLEQETRYTTLVVETDELCLAFGDLVHLERVQQTNLVAQDIQITTIEQQVAAIGNGTSAVFDQYNITVVENQSTQLTIDVTNLDVLVGTLGMDITMLADSVAMVLNGTGTNGTAVLGIIVGETLVLVGQVGTLETNTQSTVTACNDTLNGARLLLESVQIQVTLLDLTVLTTINNVLVTVLDKLLAIRTLLETLTTEISNQDTLILEVNTLIGTTMALKSDIDLLLNQTSVLLDASNSTSTLVTTQIVTTNTTLQTFITTVETFIGGTGFALLPTLAARNTSLFQQYALVVNTNTIVQGNITTVETALGALRDRVIIAENSVTSLMVLLGALDIDASQLLINSLALQIDTWTLRLNGATLLVNVTTHQASVVLLTTTYNTLQTNVLAANTTSFAQQTILDDHEARITVLENIDPGSLTPIVTFYDAVLPDVLVGEAITAGTVVSINDDGYAVTASGLRVEESRTYAQVSGGTLLPGNVLSIPGVETVHAGRDFAIDASDDFYISLNFANNASAIQFENQVLPEFASADTFNFTSANKYTGVGDVLVARYSYGNDFEWATLIDAALPVVVSSMAMHPVTDTLWLSGHITNVVNAFTFGSLGHVNDNKVFFLDHHGAVMFEYTFNIPPTATIDYLSLSFFGELSPAGEWVQLYFLDMTTWRATSNEWVTLQDLAFDSTGALYGCGFLSTNQTGETITMYRADLLNGSTVTAMTTLARDRLDLTTPAGTAAAGGGLAKASRTQGFYFSLDTSTNPVTVNYWRTDEGVDEPTLGGSAQKPWRLGSVAVDQSNRVFLMGWDDWDIGTIGTNPDAGYKRNFTLGGAGGFAAIGRQSAAGVHGMSLFEIDRTTGAYLSVMGQDAVAGTNSENCAFVSRRVYEAHSNGNEEEWEFFDPYDAGDIHATHRGDVIFFWHTFLGNTGDATCQFTTTRASDGLVSTTSFLLAAEGVSATLVQFSGFGRGVQNSVVETVSSIRFGSRDAISLAIGPDSYIWTAHISAGNSSLGGLELTNPFPPTPGVDNINLGVYFHKFDPSLNLIWGKVLTKVNSGIDEVAAFRVDRHRNLWYIEDRFSLATAVNLTQNPTFSVDDLGFSLVRSIDMTHAPIGIAMDTAPALGSTRIIMEGTTQNVTLPTVTGRAYCNYYGVLQTSKCYSMPMMGFAPSNGNLTVQVHRDGIRYGASLGNY